MKHLFIALALFVFAQPALAQRFELSTPGKVVRVTDPQITPDGKTIAVLVSRANFTDNRFDAEIVTVDVATRRQRVVATGRLSISAPRWSPDASHLAFLAHEEGRAQVFVVPASGGNAWQVTKSPTPVINFTWRPDGKAVTFTAVDEPGKKDGEERFNRSFEVSRSSYLATETPRPVHAWLAPLDGNPAKRLTSGAWTLPAPYPPGPAPPAPSFSADGKTLAFVRINSVHSGERGESTIHLLDV